MIKLGRKAASPMLRLQIATDRSEFPKRTEYEYENQPAPARHDHFRRWVGCAWVGE
jgi:hypothetical protein